MRGEVRRILGEAAAHQRFLQGQARIALRRFGPRQHLEPEVRHLVLGPVAGAHTFRWLVRVAHVQGGVVEAPAHGEHGAPGKEERLLEPIDGLPVHVPVPDVDEPFAPAVGKGRVALRLPAEVVRVGVHRQDLHVHGQGQLVGHHDVAGARGQIDRAIVLELQEHGMEAWGPRR